MGEEGLSESFQKAYDIKEMNFKPIDMEMPDASRRFELGQVMKLKVFSDGSLTYIYVGSLFVIVFFIFMFEIAYNVNILVTLRSRRWLERDMTTSFTT